MQGIQTGDADMYTYHVIKRDGKAAEFDLQKIYAAIAKAFDACKKPYTKDVIDLIALRVTSDFADKVAGGAIGVEDIQDSVEKVLSAAGYADVAKAYILYRKQRENIRNIQNTTLDYKKIVDQYLETKEEENGSVGYSIGGLILSNSGAVTANYWLSEVYDEEIATAHREGDIYIHDLGMLTGDRTMWSLDKLIQEGLGGVEGLVSSGPAKHLSTLCVQMADFLGVMQNEWAGMQSFDHFDTYLAPFVKSDQLSYKEVKQALQAFVYEVNAPVRRGLQVPHSHVILDRRPPEDMRDQRAIVGGVQTDILYGDCQEEMDLIDRCLYEVLLEGDANGMRFPYPIPAVHMDEEEHESDALLYEMAAQDGTPCFLFADRKSGIGSVGLVTIDIPRIAYLSQTEEEMMERLDRVMDLAARCLKTKRTVLEKLLLSGLYPYTKKYLGTFVSHSSTIGIMGLAEACFNAKWVRESSSQEEGKAFVIRVLSHMRQRLEVYQAMYQDHYDLTPEEDPSICRCMACKDLERYPEIQTSGGIYTQGSHFSDRKELDFFTVLEGEAVFQKMYSNVPVYEVDTEGKLSSDMVKCLVYKIAGNYDLPYCRVCGK